MAQQRLYKPLRVSGNANQLAESVLGSDPLPNTLPENTSFEDKPSTHEDQRDYDDAQLLEEARKFLDTVETADGENRSRAAEMLRFAYKRDCQWPDKIRREREGDNRPCLEINQIPAFLNQVLNDIRQNRPSIKVRGASDDATEEMATIRQDLIRHIEYDSQADAIYDNGVRYAAAGNIGYWRICTEYESEDSFDQKIVLKPIPNVMSVYYDMECSEPDGSDAEKCLVTEEISKEDFERRYPEAAPIDWQSTDPILTAWIKPDTIRIADYLHKVRHVETLYQMPDGSSVWESDLEKAKQPLPEEGEYLQKREVDRVEVRWEVINGQEILERHEWAGTYIPVIPVYGDQTNIEGETIRQGLTDRMQDSQQMYNFLITMAAEAAALQPKAPWLVPEGAIDQRERDWGMANTKNLPYLVYRATDEMGKPLPPPQRSSPDVDVQGMLGQAALFQQDMRTVSGVPDPTAQMQTQDQSGRAILAKERVSATSTYHFVDNLSRALRYTGRILLDAIPHYYDTQRTLMLLREDGSQYKTTVNQAQPQTAPVLDMHGNMIQEPQVLPPFNDLTTGKYDCVVDTGPSYASKRVEFVNSVMDLTQSNPNLWQVAGDLLVKNMDWPGAEDVADRLKVMLPPPILAQEASRSQDPMVTALSQQMQQLQQQSQQQMQAAGAQMQKLQQDLQQAQTQVLQERASKAQMQAAQAGKDQQAQADIAMQQMKSQDVQLHGRIDQERA